MDHLFSNVWQSQEICFGPAEESWISRKDQEIAWEPGSVWKFPPTMLQHLQHLQPFLGIGINMLCCLQYHYQL